MNPWFWWSSGGGGAVPPRPPRAGWVDFLRKALGWLSSGAAAPEPPVIVRQTLAVQRSASFSLAVNRTVEPVRLSLGVSRTRRFNLGVFSSAIAQE